jgi:hypothetical protein
MARPQERSTLPDSTQPAAPWALLWLGAMAGAAWVPLLLADRLPASLGARSRHPLPVASRISPQPLEPKTPLSVSPIPKISFRPGDGRPDATHHPSPKPIGRVLGQISSSPSKRFPRTPIQVEDEPKASENVPVSGSLLLGGPLGLDSLQEKPMVPAARLEQALRARSADRLEGVPPQWRPTMRALLTGSERVLPAKTVRLPASHLRVREEYPMVLKSDGMVETNQMPPPRSRAALERWAQRQEGDKEGRDRPVMVVLEPLLPESQSSIQPMEQEKAAR